MQKQFKAFAVLSAIALTVSMYSAIGASADSTDTEPDTSVTDTSIADTSSEDSSSYNGEYTETQKAHRKAIIDTLDDTEGYFRIYCEKFKDFPLEGIHWRVYKVGERQKYEDGDKFELDDKFVGWDIDLTHTNDAKEIQNLAWGLSAGVASFTPDYEFDTNSYGIVEGTLPYGLYLFEMDDFYIEWDGHYESEPILIEITDMEDKLLEDGTYESNIKEIRPKFIPEDFEDWSTPDTPSTPDSTPDIPKYPDTPSYPDTSTPSYPTPPGGSRPTNNPNTAGKMTFKTISGIALLAMAGIAGSMIGRRSKKETEEEIKEELEDNK